MSERWRTSLLVGLGALLVLFTATCAHGVGRQGDDDGGSRDASNTTDAQGHPDGGGIQDGSVQNDSSVPSDSGTACDPEPLPETSGAQCAVAIDVGVLGDVSADVVVVTGNSIPAGREIWWTFLAADDVDTAGDEFHVDIRFINNPGTSYQMDVFRGGCDAADQLATGETFNFDWYTDFPTTSTGCSGGAPCGEGDCVADTDGVNSCDDDTATFYVRVRRVDGAPSCDTFHLELSNGFYTAP